MLVDHADPERHGAPGRADGDGLSLYEDPPRIGCVEPVEDLDERGFPRPVLAEESQHFPAAQGKIDTVVHRPAIKSLDNPPHLHKVLVLGVGPRYLFVLQHNKYFLGG